MNTIKDLKEKYDGVCQKRTYNFFASKRSIRCRHSKIERKMSGAIKFGIYEVSDLYSFESWCLAYGEFGNLRSL